MRTIVYYRLTSESRPGNTRTFSITHNLHSGRGWRTLSPVVPTTPSKTIGTPPCVVRYRGGPSYQGDKHCFSLLCWRKMRAWSRFSAIPTAFVWCSVSQVEQGQFEGLAPWESGTGAEGWLDVWEPGALLPTGEGWPASSPGPDGAKPPSLQGTPAPGGRPQLHATRLPRGLRAPRLRALRFPERRPRRPWACPCTLSFQPLCRQLPGRAWIDIPRGWVCAKRCMRVARMQCRLSATSVGGIDQSCAQTSLFAAITTQSF